MSSSQWDRVMAVAADALERPAAERDAFVAAACASEPGVRREVLRMLAAGPLAGSLAGSAVVPRAVLGELAAGRGRGASPPPHPRPKQPLSEEAATLEGSMHLGHLVTPAGAPQIDGYRVSGKLGAGGMGVVWAAVQLATQRPVALKILGNATTTFASPKSRARFEREVELAAKLEHPNIARVYDSGLRHGVYYYAMERIEGQPLDEFAESRKLNRRQRMVLMRRCCRAIQHAHQRGIIHRDLKPSNILVDKEGQPHVLDFGLAKTVLESRDGALNVSIAGEVVGTPAFMSPEQAAGHMDKVDTRSDVYSLGVMLYRLVTGETPHELSGGVLEVMRRIADAEPRRPRDLDPTIDGELEAMLLKALARDPEQRYMGAGSFGKDIESYLNQEPLTAQPATTWYFLRKRLRKYRLPAAVAGGVILALTALGVWASWRVAHERNLAVASARQAQIDRVEAERQKVTAQGALAAAEEQRKHAEAAEALQRTAREAEAKAREQSDLDRKRAETALTQAEAAKAQAETSDHAARLRLAESITAQGDALMAAQRWPEARQRYLGAVSEFGKLEASPLAAELGLMDVQRHSPEPLVTFAASAGGVPVHAVAVSADGQSVFCCGDGNTVNRWSLPTGTILQTFNGHTGVVRGVLLSRDGKKLLTCGDDRTVRLWEVATARELAKLEGHHAPVWRLAFSADGRQVASGALDKELKVWDLETRQCVQTMAGHGGPVSGVRFLPGGEVLSSSHDGMLRVWDVATGNELRRMTGHRRQVYDMDVSRDGAWAVSGGYDNVVRVWDLGPGGVGKPPVELVGHVSGMHAVALAGSGPLAVTSGEDRVVRVWDVRKGKPWCALHGPEAEVDSLGCSEDGRVVVAGDMKGNIWAWDLENRGELRAIPRHGMAHHFDISRDGRMAVLASPDVGARLWDLATLRPLGPVGAPGRKARYARFTATGDGVFLADEAGMGIWDLRTGAWVSTFGEPVLNPLTYAMSADQKRVALEDGSGMLSVYDTSSGRKLFGVKDHSLGTSPRIALAFSPDGSLLASAGSDGWMKVWDVASGQVKQEYRAERADLWSAAFWPDGRRVAFGGRDHVIRVLDAGTGQLEAPPFPGHPNVVSALAFTADGSRLMSGGADGTVRLFDAATRAELRSFARVRPNPFTADNDIVHKIAYCDATQTLLARGGDDVVDVWEFGRWSQYLRGRPRASAALVTLHERPADGESLALLGQWYAFRGMAPWAMDLLRRARAASVNVPSLDVARAAWLAGDLALAENEFKAGIEQKAAPELYLSLCLSAVRREVGGR